MAMWDKFDNYFIQINSSMEIIFRIRCAMNHLVAKCHGRQALVLPDTFGLLRK